MRKGIILAALVAAFSCPAMAQYCYTLAGVCYPYPNPLGIECKPPSATSSVPCPAPTPTATPTPTPTVTPPPAPTPTSTPVPFIGREADVTWKPTWKGITANYIEEPTATLTSDGHLWLLAHAGNCCPGIEDPRGWEIPILLDYGPAAMTPYYPLVDYNMARYGDHEMDASGLVRLDAQRWVLFGARTTRASWHGGLPQNRVRGMVTVTEDPRQSPIPNTVRDWIGPWDDACVLRESCQTYHGSIGGPNLTRGVWFRGMLLLYGWDDVGYLWGGDRRGTEIVWQVIPDPPSPQAWTPGAAIKLWMTDTPTPFTDVALGDDGRLYGLGLGDPLAGCWAYNCRGIREWVSEDGIHWTQGVRSWSLPARPDDCVWMGGYVRDEWGGIKRGAMAVIGMVSPGCVWATPGPWNLHIWADPGLVERLPASLMGVPRAGVRRHLQSLHEQALTAPRRNR